MFFLLIFYSFNLYAMIIKYPFDELSELCFYSIIFINFKTKTVINMIDLSQDWNK
jgi:hypothetical protein